MKVTIEKPPFELIWLDTHAIIAMARALNDKSAKPEDKKKYENLVARISKLTDDCKILCPEADQDIEYEQGRRLIEEIRHLQTRMSKGIRVLTYNAVGDYQLSLIMKAHIDKEDSVDLPWMGIFYRDPIKDLQDKSPFIVTVHHSTSEQELIEINDSHREIARIWENIRIERIKNKINFPTALKMEYTGYGSAVSSDFFSHLEKQMKNMPISFEDMIKSIDIVGRPISLWDHYNGTPKGLSGLLDFYNSEDFKAIPSVNISCKLVGDLTTGQEKIRPSDIMDVHQLGAILPYCHYAVTDGAMRNRIVGKLKLDKEYNVRVVKLSELDNLLDKIEADML